MVLSDGVQEHVMAWNALRGAVAVSLLVGGSASPHAQGLPDFSGIWVLETAKERPEVARTMTVIQTLVRTNVRGEPMTPFYRDFTVSRGETTESYTIGAIGGSVVSSVPSRRTHQRVGWMEQTLVIESGSYTGPVRESGQWQERRESWSLDAAGRLQLTVETRDAQESRRETLVYRRRR
jgi:hypothetical protein